MGEVTKIGWCHHTFNAWWGCHKVSPACKNCYAESFSKRTGHKVWGADAPRRFFGDKHWREPLKWNREAEAAGERRRVFCGSMMDVCETHADAEIAVKQQGARVELGMLIGDTPHLDWLLLTKRPEEFPRAFPFWEDGCPPNVWVGATVENNDYRWRIEELLKIQAAVHFLSCEPLLGPIDATEYMHDSTCNELRGYGRADDCTCSEPRERRISWVIAGGESGHHSREHQLEWSRSLRDQCAAAGAAFFFKQTGEAATEGVLPNETPIGRLLNPDRAPTRRHLKLAPRSKGEKLHEIPADLRIREFPRVG